MSAIEKPRHTVIERDGDVEIRAYESFVVAETRVAADLGPASDEGFRRLADYIFGANETNDGTPEKIAMTAPVQMEPAGDSWIMTFMMPNAYDLDALPDPVDDRVSLREQPARTIAALTYSGTWSAQRFAEREAHLRSWITARGLVADGPSIFARYDPPFVPWFLRRNEVLIPIRGAHESARAAPR